MADARQTLTREQKRAVLAMADQGELAHFAGRHWRAASPDGAGCIKFQNGTVDALLQRGLCKLVYDSCHRRSHSAKLTEVGRLVAIGLWASLGEAVDLTEAVQVTLYPARQR